MTGCLNLPVQREHSGNPGGQRGVGHRSRLVGAWVAQEGDEEGCGIVHRIGNGVDEERTASPAEGALSTDSDHLERPSAKTLESTASR